MCYFQNATYKCSPKPLAVRAHLHEFRSSVLCANPTPCPLPFWETRTTHWPFPCPNCTGETAVFEPPVHDDWNYQSQETHEEAAERYVSSLARFIDAITLSRLPATPANLLSVCEALHLETSCRQHPGRLKGDCPSWGKDRYKYNLASALRASTARRTLENLVQIPGIFAVLGDVKAQIQAMALDVAPLCPAEGADHSAPSHVHAAIDPKRPVTPDPVFSRLESARREDSAACAREEAVAAMDATLAPLLYNTAVTARVGVDFRAQAVRAFSIFVVNDPGLSSVRADMVLERLAGLIRDPFFFPAASPPEFDTTRPLLGSLMAHLANSEDSQDNPFVSLQSRLDGRVSEERDWHNRELEKELAYHLAFQDGTTPTDNRTTVKCSDPCKRTRNPPNPLEDFDPQTHHAPRVRVRVCRHIMGRNCAFRRGKESSAWQDNELVYVCPHKECLRATGSVTHTDQFGMRTFVRPFDAAMSGDMERAFLRTTYT